MNQQQNIYSENECQGSSICTWGGYLSEVPLRHAPSGCVSGASESQRSAWAHLPKEEEGFCLSRCPGVFLYPEVLKACKKLMESLACLVSEKPFFWYHYVMMAFQRNWKVNYFIAWSLLRMLNCTLIGTYCKILFLTEQYLFRLTSLQLLLDLYLKLFILYKPDWKRGETSVFPNFLHATPTPVQKNDCYCCFKSYLPLKERCFKFTGKRHFF